MAGDKHDADSVEGAPAGARQLYEPPMIEETAEFETLALTCLHTPGGPGECDEFVGEPQS
jgi:hypothetical protein